VIWFRLSHKYPHELGVFFLFTFKEFLAERVLSIGINPEHEQLRSRYTDEIAELLLRTYSTLDGGYAGMGVGTSAEREAVLGDISSSMIKVVTRDGRVSACTLYRDKFGRKSIASATDGSTQGKLDLRMIKSEDHREQRAWGEVSGAMEHMAKKMGVPSIPASEVPSLTGKEVTPHPDGVHYDRRIGNDIHTKMAIGYPKR
jgi:hypothetical protein